MQKSGDEYTGIIVSVRTALHVLVFNPQFTISGTYKASENRRGWTLHYI